MILSESVVVKPKKLVLLLVISCQTAHVNSRFIDGRGLLISDIAEECDLQN